MVRESISYSEASTEERLFGVEQAFSASIKASYFLQKAYESKLFDIEYSKLNKKQREKITKNERARKGGIARAKRFAPLKSFVIGEYHKKTYESDPNAARELAEKLAGFCIRHPEHHRLSPLKASSTIRSWIKEHKESNACIICEEKYGSSSSRKKREKEKVTSA